MHLCLGCSSPSNCVCLSCKTTAQAKKLLVVKQAFRLVIAQTVPRRPVQSQNPKNQRGKSQQKKMFYAWPKSGRDTHISKPSGKYQEAGEKGREDPNHQDIKEKREHSWGMVFEQCYQLKKIKQ